MKKRQSLTDQALFLLGGRITSFALTFALPLVLVRIFSKYEFGLYRKFSVFFLVFFIIAQFGLTYSLPSLIPRFPEKAKSILANTVFVQFLICGFLICSGAWIAFNGAAWHIPKDFMRFAFPLGIFSGFMVASSPFDQVLVIEEKGQQAGSLIALFDLGRSVFVLTSAYFLRDIILVMWAVSIVAFLRFVGMVFYFRKNYGLSLQQLHAQTFCEQMQLAGPMAVQSGAHLIESHIDKYLIIYYYSTATYAVYTVGAFQIPIVAMLFNSITAVILPRLAELYRQNKRDDLLALWNEAIRKSAIILFPLFALMFTVHREFILYLFTDKYIESIPIFAVYLWIIPTYIMANNLLLQAIGHGKYLFWTGIFKPILAIFIVFFGLQWGGLIGAAAGLILYQYLATILYAFYSARALKVSVRDLVPTRALLQVVLLMAIASLSTVFLTQWLMWSVFLMLMTKSVIFCGIGILLLYRSSALTPADRDRAKSLVIRVLTKFRLLQPKES